ncbi:MAG: hypothetical protein GXP27_16350 [Planctomycetes bacterium]|nr:hypothetical protein [Planctomycetota bacterium]
MADVQRQLFDLEVRRPLLERDRPAPHNRTETSRVAAARVRPAAGTKRAIVLEAVLAAGDAGATIDEIVQVTGLLTQTVCGRINELKRDGWIQDSGRRRPTRHGSPAIVWIQR